MSGLEVAGVVLGAFPLLVSGIEHWRDVAKIGGFFWRIRKEYTKCLHDVQFHEIIYKKNLKELLLPLIPDADEVAKLIADPGGQRWTDVALQDRLESRLHESYRLYYETIMEMNSVVQELKEELCFDRENVQDRLKIIGKRQTSSNRSPSAQLSAKFSKLSLAKSRIDYEAFRIRFSVGEGVRGDLFVLLKKCNERLEKLLHSSDRVAALETATTGPVKHISILESAFRKVSQKSDSLFRALNNAWQCSCQQFHLANLRMEHRTLTGVYFEILLSFSAPSKRIDMSWCWRAIRCGDIPGCSSAQKTTDAVKSGHTCQPTTLTTLAPKTPKTPKLSRQKTVSFGGPVISVPQIETDVPIDRNVRLCQLLSNEKFGECMGIIGHNDDTFHIHPFTRQGEDKARSSVTLDHMLSQDFEGHISRRERYSIALLVASSVGQLASTPWLRNTLCKEDIIFFPLYDDQCQDLYGEPFIQQDFSDGRKVLTSSDPSTDEYNFYSLGILLLELCFGSRLEDHPLRKKYPATSDPVAMHAFDVMAALDWSRRVSDEAGNGYATAVKWCFMSATAKGKSWRGEIIGNVVQPLETCLKHLQTAAAVQ